MPKPFFRIDEFEYSIVSDRLYRNGKRLLGFKFGLYQGVCFNGTSILMHRFIWRLVTGEWPTHEIDHVNRNKRDNRWLNLREATHSENGQNRDVYKNNRTGIKGVGWYPPLQKYRARISKDGATINLGYFDTIEEATEARNKAELELFTHAIR